MPPQRILVTGAGGFVGRHLLPILRQTFPAAEIFESAFDVTDREAAQAGIADVRPDALVHLAAIAAPRRARDDPYTAWRVNLHGTLNVARAILATVPDCMMLFASTADAYGASFSAGVPLDETAPLAPLNTYGATKAAADLALRAMAEDGLRVIRARPVNHTGPGQTEAFVVPAFARQVARIGAGLQEPVLQVGALHPRRDFLDVRDVCSAYASILSDASVLPAHGILNIASGKPRRIGDILAFLIESAGLQAEIRIDTRRLRPSDIAVTCGDAGLARRVLGWAPRISWEQTLADVQAEWCDSTAASHCPKPDEP